TRSRLLCVCVQGLRVRRAVAYFPTRRSSDLFIGLRLPVDAHGLVGPDRIVRNRAGFEAGGLGGDRREEEGEHLCQPCALCRSFRSEEHTSELQSRANLVCRLLLEKKTTLEHG